MAGFNVPAYNPTPIESPQNALMRGLETQRAQQGNALQSMQLQALMQRQQQEQAAQAQAAQLAQQRQRYLGSVSGQAGPPAEFNPLQAFAAGFKPDEIKALSPQTKLMNVGAGGSVFDPATGKPVYTAPFKPAEDKTPEALRTLEAIYGKGTPEFQQAARMLAQKMTTHTPAASIVNYGSPVPVQLPDGTTGYVQPSNRGGPAAPMASPDGRPLVKPSESDTKALTEGQAKAVTFAARMESADKVLAGLSRKGVLTTVPGGMGNNAVGSAITAMAPADQQQLMQAKRNFINAVLRRESGAVISADEFANAERQYFPQIGESRPVIEQKARERRVAIEGMRADVPKGRQAEVDRISTGASAAGAGNDDPLGLRGK